MTKAQDLDVLQRIADRSLEGHPMSLSGLHEAGIEPAALRQLELAGFVEIDDGGAERSVALTDVGLSVLAPGSGT